MRVRVYEVAVTESSCRTWVNSLLLPNISNVPRKAEPVIHLCPGWRGQERNNRGRTKENRSSFYKAATSMYQAIMFSGSKCYTATEAANCTTWWLHKVPFTALTDGKEFMVDKYSISVLPSASVIEHLVRNASREKRAFWHWPIQRLAICHLDLRKRKGCHFTAVWTERNI